MRVPLSKVYRAFPELDTFSDEECERYVATARERHQFSEGGVGLLAVLASIGSIVLLANLLIRAVQATLPLFHFRMARDDRDALALLAGGGLGLLGGVLVGFLIRDFWLRWAIKTCLKVAKCACGYSLLGLTVRAGTVVCPECGVKLVLAVVGLTEADLLARSESPHPTSASPNDSP